MTRTASETLRAAVQAPTTDGDTNRMVALITTGKAPLGALAALGFEQHHIIASDRRSFLHLAGRADGSAPAGAFFRGLAQGEDLALEKLSAFTTACGADERAVAAYHPQAGCQAYPAYVAWLALNADPVDVVIALTANFAAWGRYCAAVGQALRVHYGFDDEACGFFDFFAAPAPEPERQALDAVQAALDAGRLTDASARYSRLLRSYELMFWNTLADGAV